MLYFVFIYLVIILGYIPVKANIINKKIYCIFVGVTLFLILGLRHPLVGQGDTYNVYLSNFTDIYLGGISVAFNQDKDIVFQLATYFFGETFELNTHLYVFIFSLPCIYSVTKLIYLYSKMPMLSFIVFSSLHFYGFAFSAMRQINAMALLLLSYTFLKKKKYFKFFLCIVIASLFHQVAIVFAIVPIFQFIFERFNINKIYLFMFPVLGLINSLLLKDWLRNFINVIASIEDRYAHMVEQNQTTNLTSFFIYLVILIFSFITLKNKGQDRSLLLLLIITSIGTFFAPMSLVAREFGRVAYCFSIFNILLIPRVVSTIHSGKLRFLTILFLVIIFILYFFNNMIENMELIPYVPYWETYPNYIFN